MNAVHNALAPVGVKHVEMPATPLKTCGNRSKAPSTPAAE